MRGGPLLGLLLLSLAAAAGAGSPRVDYILHCMGCHLADGAETPGKVPALRGRIDKFLAVPGGREFLVRVPGVAQTPLSDVEVAALLNWLIEEFGEHGRPDGVAPYTGGEVAEYRREPLAEVAATRAALVEQFPAE